MESIGPLAIGLIAGVVVVTIVAIYRKVKGAPAASGESRRPAVAGAAPAASDAPGHGSPVEDVAIYIDLAVRGGFEDRDEIIEAAREMAEEDDDDDAAS